MFDRSRKELSAIVQMLQKMLEVFSIILFAVFTLFYLYQFIAFIGDSVIRAIIYFILLAFHTAIFVIPKVEKIDELETHAERYEQRRALRAKKRTFKIIKMSVNALAIGWNFIDIVLGKCSDLKIMIVIITAILLFAQVLLEIVLSLLLVYFDNFRIAIIEDIKDIDLDSNLVTKFLSKSLGIKKVIEKVSDENYLSETEKEIARKQKEKK
ncbi:MAG: hypothetical protein MJZ37_06630 [Bacilli bacterium]|nr:hypothetical protein [Bacilli bacterium]